MRTVLLASAVAVACLLTSLRAEAAAPRSQLVLNVTPNTTLPAGPTQDSARDFLIARAAIPKHVTIVAGRTFSLKGATVYRFEQTHMGVPVFSRGAGIAVDDHGRVILATSHVESQLPSSVAPSVSAEGAAAIAMDASGLSAEARHARLMVVPMPGRARLVWMVQVPPVLPEVVAPLVTVDALSGRVLAMVDATRYKNQAKVFTINPVEDNEVPTTVALPISDPDTTTQNADIVSYNCVDNGTLKLTKSQHGGLRVTHICDLMQAQPDTNGDFLQYDRAANDAWGDDFSELQAFYHANKAYEYFRSFDGNDTFKLATTDQPLFTISNWLTTPRGVRLDGGVSEGGEGGSEEAGDLDGSGEASTIDVTGMDAGLLTPYQNAAYASYTPGSSFGAWSYYPDQITGGMIQLGQGVYADYSYDGEVVYHEFTHAVVNATINLVPYWHLDSQGATMSPGALNEGLADFFAASISERAKMGTYAVKDSEFKSDCIRNLDNDAQCPKDMAGEVHADGLLLTGGLWKVRAALPDAAQQKKFSETVFTVMTTITDGDLGFEDLADAIVKALATNMDAATSKALEDEFTARGILPACDRIFEYKGSLLNGTTASLSNTFTIGGTMEFNSIPAIQYAPGIFQVKVPLNPGATEITATFKGIAGSGFGGGGFTPFHLVKFDERIVFDVSLGFSANTTEMFEATSNIADAGADTIQTFTAHIPVKEGAQAAYVMLINKGETGAYYYNVGFKTDGVEADVQIPDDGAAGAAGGGPDTDGGADASTEPAAPATADDDGGCGCRVLPVSSGSSTSLALLAAAALLARRRITSK
jgi:Zn-dependent metalloprotease